VLVGGLADDHLNTSSGTRSASRVMLDSDSRRPMFRACPRELPGFCM
jgi:hypothetical protein